MKPTAVSLIAGVGGLDLGFERAGFETVAAVEIEPDCRKVLAAKFPRAQLFDDVRTVGKHNLPSADALLFGFPCQDLSIAGKGAGLAGSRSGLYFEATRIADELRPAFLLWENVPGLLSSDEREGLNGRDFCRVLMELARIGYHGAWRVLDARHFGVAQRRRRVFGCFSRLDSGAARCAEILSLAEGMRGHPPPRPSAGKGIAGTITRSPFGGGSPTGGDGRENSLVPEYAGAIVSGGDGHSAGSATLQDAASNLLIPEGEVPEIGKALTTSNQRLDFETETLLVDGVYSASDYKTGAFEEADAARPLTRSADRSRAAPVVAFSAKDDGGAGGALSPTLRAGNAANSNRNGGVMPAVSTPRGVRRLTPTECERLQGVPDGWTAGFSDAARYRMLGNMVAVPCAEWIAKRMRKHINK